MDGRIGCQTYSWEMLGAAWQGSPDDIMDAVSEAGYDGIEFSNVMIGRLRAGAGPPGRGVGTARDQAGRVRLFQHGVHRSGPLRGRSRRRRAGAGVLPGDGRAAVPGRRGVTLARGLRPAHRPGDPFLSSRG